MRSFRGSNVTILSPRSRWSCTDAPGAVTSSFAFFFSLGFGARLLAPVFARPRAWQVLDGIIGLVMWAIAAKLLLGT